MAVRKLKIAVPPAPPAPVPREREMAEAVAEMFYTAHDLLMSQDSAISQRGRHILAEARITSLQMDLRLAQRRTQH